MALAKKQRPLCAHSRRELCLKHCMTPERGGRPSALRCGEGSWTPDLSGVFSSAGKWVISSVLSPLRKGFLDLFVLAAALASTSESSISWIPRSPRRKTSNSSSSHFRTGVGRELPLALKISLSNNFHMKCIYYPSLLLPELAKPVFNPDTFKMFRFSHPVLTVCSISSSAWFRLGVKSQHSRNCTVWKEQMLPCENIFSMWERNSNSLSMKWIPEARGIDLHVIAACFKSWTAQWCCGIRALLDGKYRYLDYIWYI